MGSPVIKKALIQFGISFPGVTRSSSAVWHLQHRFQSDRAPKKNGWQWNDSSFDFQVPKLFNDIGFKIPVAPADKVKPRSRARRSYHASATKENDGRKWQVVGAMCLERSPAVSAPKNAVEQEFWRTLQQQEFELSLFSDHEMNKFEDKRRAKQKEESDSIFDKDLVLQTAQDREDKWNENFEAFRPAPRETEADRNNDQKSLNRKLDRKLYLVVNQILGSSPKWVFPQTAWQPGESAKETAERALKNMCGDGLQVTPLGGAPIGCYHYRYPSEAELSKDYYGAKVFFFKALYKKGELNLSKHVADYNWVTRDEMQQTVYERYFDRVERFMYEFDAGDIREPDHDNFMRMRF